MSPETAEQQTVNGAPVPPAGPKQEVSLELLKYKEELADKMGLPSSYAMGLMKELSVDLVDSGMAPTHFKSNPMALYLAAMRGREMGLGPLESILETFWAAPGGRLGIYSNKAMDLMHRNKVITKIIIETKDRCEILFTPPQPHEPYTATFEFREAVEAGLVKPDSNWVKWPVDMCRARAIGRGWRVIGGTFKGSANLYLKEELEDQEWQPAQSDVPAGEPVVEVKVGTKPKTPAPGPVIVDAKPAAPPAEAKPVEAKAAPTKVSDTFHIEGEPDQSNYDNACLRAQALANEKKVPVEVTRITKMSDGTETRISVGTFQPPTDMPRTAPPPAPAPAPAADAPPAAPAAPVDAAKEALIARARAAYALIMPGGEEKLRKQIGDMFCSGYYGVAVPREWPRNIEDRTKGVEALELAIKTNLPRLVDSPVSARDFGREMAAKAKAPAAAPAPPAEDPSAPLYAKLGWSPVTCAVAARFKAKFGIEPQDFEDYIASLKLDFLPDADACAYMAIGAVMGRTYKTEGSNEQQYPMKTLFALGEKGAGSYSEIVKAVEMYNDLPLAQIQPAKLMADLTKMLKKLSEQAEQADPGDDGWGQ